MNTDETSNCHEVCPVFNWYNKHVPPHATRMFNKILGTKITSEVITLLNAAR